MHRIMRWSGILGITIALTASRGLAAEDQATDFDAEQKQIEKEDAEQKAERDKGIKGKYQRVFFGTVYLLTQTNEELSPDVIGNFVTNNADLKPKRNYLMKLSRDSKGLVDALKKLNGKSVKVTGALRIIGPNGEAKYLIVDSVSEEGPTPRVPERRSASGL